ncbi:hypothetical protein FRC11_002916 [Ceratobasidium sp. 423]|nr:hypothetical protein FRC11_002916 [Ceratobasidium sp. 423]
MVSGLLDKDLSIPDMRSLATQFQQDLIDDEDLPEDKGEVGSNTNITVPVVPLPKMVRLFFLAHKYRYFFKIFLITRQVLGMELELYGLATRERQKDFDTGDADN